MERFYYFDGIEVKQRRKGGAEYLNNGLKTIDPAPVGNKLVTGALDTLLAVETERRIKLLIAGVSNQAGKDISILINKSFSDLSSSANKAKLNSVLLSLFDTSSSDSLSSFISRSVNQVDLEGLGLSLRDDIFRSSLRPEIDSIARTAVRAIFDEIRKDNTAQGFFANIRNIIFLVVGLLGLMIALLFWLNR